MSTGPDTDAVPATPEHPSAPAPAGGSKLPRWARWAGAGAILFFLVKGILWLVLGAGAIYLWRGGNGS